MDNIMKRITLLAIGLAMAFSITLQGQVEGNDAPDFEVNLLDGGTFNLSDQSGKVVLIFLFGNTCPPCLAAGPNIESSLNQVFTDDPNFTAVGLDTWDGSSNTASVTGFRSRTGITFPLAIKAGHVAATYSTTYDRLMVIDHNGVLVHKGIINAANDINNAKAAIAASLATISEDPCSSANILISETVDRPLCGEASTGSIRIAVSGENGPFQINWFDDSDLDSITGLSQGCYAVEVSDANGCQETKEICITIPEPMAVDWVKSDLACYGDSSGTLSVQVSGGTPPYSARLGDNLFSTSIENLPSGEFMLTVLDNNGCEVLDLVSLTEPDQIPIGDISGPLEVEATQTYMYALSGTETSTIQWSVEGGSIVSGQGTPDVEIQWGSGSQGALEALAATETGCQSEKVQLEVSIQNATGINDFRNLQFAVYPNPVTEVLKIPYEGDLEVSLYDITGVLILSTLDKQIDMNPYRKGTYILLIQKEALIIRIPVLKL
jgi:peroxiredoxin